MSEPSVLADVNVWLATVVERHPHHPVAVAWWRDKVLPSGTTVAFCRITQLGLLRLLTNEKVMGEQRRTAAQAWKDFHQLLAQDPVIYASEPVGIEPVLEKHCQLGSASRNFWTDAYLAAFAEAGDFSFATFDKGFRRFPHLRFTLLAESH